MVVAVVEEESLCLRSFVPLRLLCNVYNTPVMSFFVLKTKLNFLECPGTTDGLLREHVWSIDLDETVRVLSQKIILSPIFDFCHPYFRSVGRK